MKKLLTIILILCSVASFGQMRGGAQYDPGAARKNLSNVDAAATPSMTSITLSDKVQAAWANILGDIYASGTVKVSAGSAAAPAFSFASDPDTGVYRSADNTLALTAGGAQGLLVGADGVGIGAGPSAGYELELAGTNKTVTARIRNLSSLLETNATQYRIALTVDATNQPIATGVTSAGYVHGLNVDGFLETAAFQGTLTTLRGARIRSGINQGTGTVTNCYALQLSNLNTTGTITNNWALYQDTAAARNYFAGRTLFGTTTDDGVSSVQVAGGGLRLVGAAAPSTPAEGTLYFNSSDKHFYGWNGTAWVQLDN